MCDHNFVQTAEQNFNMRLNFVLLVRLLKLTFIQIKEQNNVVGCGHLDQGWVCFVDKNGQASRKQNACKILRIFMIEN